MLTTLRIKNLALVPELSLDVAKGYTAITGETGAGKSILIGALNLLLGERADRSLIRTGTDSCSVEAVFEIRALEPRLGEFLDENGLEPCENGQLLLRRTFTTSGANRQFINGSPATLQALARIGEWLVDLHGPHEHQSLLHPARQLLVLDAFANLTPDRQAFAGLIRQRAVLENQKRELIVDEQSYARELDLLRFQIREIKSAGLQPHEEETIEAEHSRSQNAARLIETSRNALGLLSDDDESLLNRAGALGRLLNDLQRLDPAAAGLFQTHQSGVALWRELQQSLSEYADRIALDPERLQQLEERINLIHSLKRKYGSTLAAVIDFGAEAEKKLQSLEERDVQLARINLELETISKNLARAGGELSEGRRKAAPKLAQKAGSLLKELGFERCRFEIQVAPRSGGDPTSTGFDEVAFQFSPNVGEPLKPLASIASSGEIARVMLALKATLAAEDEVPVLIFDEVDANIGGETARAVGEKMAEIARRHQVLCITHLAPVAALASTHYVVTKKVMEGRTISEIKLLNAKERVVELARMLGGTGEAARKHAETMLKDKF